MINKVELTGIVGRVEICNVGDRKCARLSVATDYAYRNRQGEAVVETTWHNVVAFEGPQIDIDHLLKGDAVVISGRIRNARCTGIDGDVHCFMEILANRMENVTKGEALR